MPFQTLSILVPCYNEEGMISLILQRILNAPCSLAREIIIVDDGSTDQTVAAIEAFIAANPGENIQTCRHAINKGKGASIHTGIARAQGDIILIQDADLEYNPEEVNRLLKPITDGYADVVYGSRFRGGDAHRVLFFMHTIGNKFLTFLSNLFTGINLTDMETGYKMFKADILKGLTLKENRFGFEPEVTAKLSRVKNIRIYEVGISYYGRSYSDGKKVRWPDGFRAIWCIIKYNIFSRT